MLVSIDLLFKHMQFSLSYFSSLVLLKQFHGVSVSEADNESSSSIVHIPFFSFNIFIIR